MRKKLAFSKSFNLSPTQRIESGAWVFIGNWKSARNLANSGSQRVLCVPPGDDPLKFDWTILRGAHVVVWLYQKIEVKKFLVHLRDAGVLDISIFDRITGKFVGLALTTHSEMLLSEINGVKA